jgi:hypothetical protein
MLQWLRENYTAQFDSGVMDVAISEEQLEPDTVQWLRENLTDAEARKWYISTQAAKDHLMPKNHRRA